MFKLINGSYININHIQHIEIFSTFYEIMGEMKEAFQARLYTSSKMFNTSLMDSREEVLEYLDQFLELDREVTVLSPGELKERKRKERELIEEVHRKTLEEELAKEVKPKKGKKTKEE